MKYKAITILLFIVIFATTIYSVPANSKALVKNKKPLQPNSFYLLPLTSIKPRGWLRGQLRIQANGLTGHLDEFWPDLGPNSAWLGGSGEGWERGPYFMDGLIPLAYLLDDPILMAKANKWVEWTLKNQRPDGAIGPTKNKDWWPNMVMLKVLMQYHEATNDPRVIPLMRRYYQYRFSNAKDKPLHEWARFRWYEELVSILWLYNRTGDQSLLQLANVVKEQGYNWRAHFEDFKFTTKTSREGLGLVKGVDNTEMALSAHGVNNAMALKASPLWWLISGDDRDKKGIYKQYEALDTYHLLPNGMPSGDEHYAGKNPSQGVELCAVVEAMFSLEHSIAVLGDVALADRLEKITYNALPGTLTADMWAHQYDQQPNQIMCNIQKRDWSSNGPESNVFGLEPFFGCCTANMHQGWPKFASSLWMATNDDGLVAVAYAPSKVSAIVKGNVKVNVVEETEYPFREKINFTLNPAKSVTFPLKLRIPIWASNVKIKVNGTAIKNVKAGTFHSINRLWKKGDKVELTLPMQLSSLQGYQNSISIERGPLVFSLKIGEEWKQIKSGMHKPAKPPAADWEVLPTTEWNYALIVDKNKLPSDVKLIEKPLGTNLFSSEGAPIELQVKGKRVPEWSVINGSAGPPPTSPVSSNQPETTLTLIPYGSAKLRITSFPYIAAP
jgi:uncharacterized protein